MLYTILIVVGLLVLGLIKTLISLKNDITDYNYIKEYFEKFNKFVDETIKKKTIGADYNWLVSNSDKTQDILGEVGIINYSQFNKLYNNVPLILNFVNNVISTMCDKFISEINIQQIEWCQTAFLRKLGILDETIKKSKKRLLNPFYIFTSGIRFILEIPIYILYSVGLLSTNNKNKITKNIIFKILSGLLSLLTIFSTIMSVLIGWDEFIEIIKKII